MRRSWNSKFQDQKRNRQTDIAQTAYNGLKRTCLKLLWDLGILIRSVIFLVNDINDITVRTRKLRRHL